MQEAAVDALIAIGDAVIPAMKEIMHKPVLNRVRRAAEVLTALGDSRAVLQSILIHQGFRQLKREAGQRPKVIEEIIQELISHDSLCLKLMAREALIYIGPAAAEQLRQHLIKFNDYDRRQIIIHTLSLMGLDAACALDVLESLAEDDNPRIREAVMLAIDWITHDTWRKKGADNYWIVEKRILRGVKHDEVWFFLTPRQNRNYGVIIIGSASSPHSLVLNNEENLTERIINLSKRQREIGFVRPEFLAELKKYRIGRYEVNYCAYRNPAKYTKGVEFFEPQSEAEALKMFGDYGRVIWQRHLERSALRQSTQEKCFLCPAFMPAIEEIVEWGNWYMVMQPFPISGAHQFLLVHKEHRPQTSVVDSRVISELVQFISQAPEARLFINGVANSIDMHLHAQGVLGPLPAETATIEKIAQRGAVSIGRWNKDSWPSFAFHFSSTQRAPLAEEFSAFLTEAVKIRLFKDNLPHKLGLDLGFINNPALPYITASLGHRQHYKPQTYWQDVACGWLETWGAEIVFTPEQLALIDPESIPTPQAEKIIETAISEIGCSHRTADLKPLYDYLSASSSVPGALSAYDARLAKRDIAQYRGGNYDASKIENSAKFFPDGRQKLFYGVTCIAWVRPGTPVYMQLSDVQDRIRQRLIEEEEKLAGIPGEAEFIIENTRDKDKVDSEVYVVPEYLRAQRLVDVFSFLAKPSFHMTVCDVDPSKKFNPQELPYVPVSRQQFEERLGQISVAFGEIGAPRKVNAFVRGVGLKGVVSALVRFDEETELEKTTTMERVIKSHIGVSVRDFSGHISLAYAVKYPGHRRFDTVLDVLAQFRDYDFGRFDFDSFDFTYFFDIDNFIPLATKNLGN